MLNPGERRACVGIHYQIHQALPSQFLIEKSLLKIKLQSLLILVNLIPVFLFIIDP